MPTRLREREFSQLLVRPARHNRAVMSQTPSSRAREPVTIVSAFLDPGVGDPPAPMTAAQLLDEETRLLAQAVGDHVPLEVALQVAELRRRRTLLG